MKKRHGTINLGDGHPTVSRPSTGRSAPQNLLGQPPTSPTRHHLLPAGQKSTPTPPEEPTVETLNEFSRTLGERDITTSSMSRHDEWTREKYHFASQGNELYNHLKRLDENTSVTVQQAQLALVRFPASRSGLFPFTRPGAGHSATPRKMSLLPPRKPPETRFCWARWSGEGGMSTHATCCQAPPNDAWKGTSL